MTALYLGWDLATGLNISDKSCALSARGFDAVAYLLVIVLAAFTALRVYALGRRLCVLLLLSYPWCLLESTLLTSGSD
ncbi:hypothetical protein BD310DRAFT_923850 [Dichomitus squalens]|uniref:Uncharacterized protein n=1 Tax=Dichomitus squalens TaxID=114155 RepID=A0A4Q9PZN6_9APHY|nr:hypothetical protein BD310DRAFT_923850 [Dichomitus squalens]